MSENQFSATRSPQRQPAPRHAHRLLRRKKKAEETHNLAQMTEAGEGLETQLSELYRSSPGSYAQAIQTLQGQIGNSGVIQLHEKVAAQAGTTPASLAVEAGRTGQRGPLPHRDQLENSFQTGLDQVEYFSGPAAQAATTMVGARAFAAGNTIVSGENDPDVALVAHEVTHVLQQGGHDDLQGLEMAGPHDASEVQADAIGKTAAHGLPITTPITPTSRGGKADPNQTTSTPPAPPDYGKLVESAGITKKSQPKLHSFLTQKIKDDPALQSQLTGGSLSKLDLIAIGRQAWRAKVTQNSVFLRQLAKELGDSNASTKLEQVAKEKYFDPAASPHKLRMDYYKEVADLVVDKANPAYVEGNQIYNENEPSPMTVVAMADNGKRFYQKGIPVDIPKQNPLLYRSSGLSAYWGRNVTPKYKELWLDRLKKLVAKTHQSTIDTASAGYLPGTDMVSVFEYWAYSCATKDKHRLEAYKGFDRDKPIGGGQGTTWWSYMGIELEEFPVPEMRAQAGFQKAMDFAALLTSWGYQEGMVRYTISGTEMEKSEKAGGGPYLRKPTAFDGMATMLWVQDTIPESKWGITKGGAPEAVAPFIPGKMVLSGAQGIDILPSGADLVFSKMEKYMADKGSAAGKKEFAPGNKPANVSIMFNPIFKFPVPANAGTSLKIKEPPVQHSGVTFKEVDLQLAKEEESGPGVKSGQIKMDVDAAGAISKKDVVAKVTPGEGGDVDGKATNEIKGATSKLDKFLGRVTTDLKLVDGGVQGTIAVKEGESGIPGIKLTAAEVTIGFINGQLTAQGKLGISDKTGKLSGQVEVGWDGQEWSIKGTANVKELVEGLSEFEVEVFHRAGETKIRCPEVSYTKKFSAVTVTGTAENVEYDVNAGAFSAALSVEAETGMFGKAKASGLIKKNKVKKLEFTYESPELKYPSKGDKQVLKGTFSATITYENGNFSGSFNGTANLNLPGLDKLTGGPDGKGLGLALNAKVNPAGTFSGSIKTTTPLQIGKYFAINSLAATIHEDGSVTSEFEIAVTNIGFLKDAKLKAKIDKDGFHVVEASITVPFGQEGKTRAWGSIGATYQEKGGLTINGKVWLKIKEGMIAHGDVTYTTEKNELSAELGVDDITILDYHPDPKLLFEFSKDIVIFTVYQIVGLYLNVGLDLKFKFDMDLKISPKVKLEGLSLDDFSFKSVSADIGLSGGISAKLIASPKLGVGLFALHPSILKGGGGLKMPITAEAKIVPSGSVGVTYKPDGGVSGQAKIGMALLFGITATINPYAEFSVLDGAFEKTWEGDPLTSFTILPEKELFSFVLDLGGDLNKQEKPSIPDKAGEPQQQDADKKLEQKDQGKKETPAPKGQKDQEGAESSSAEEGEDQEGGFSIGMLIDKILELPKLAPIRSAIKAAGEAWEKIKGFFKGIAKFFKNWFDKIAAGIEEVLQGFAKYGFIGYLKIVLRSAMGPELYDIIEPLLDALGDIEKLITGLVEKPMPSSPSEFFGWAIDLIGSLLGIGWSSLTSLAKGLEKMFSRAGKAAVKFINYLVETGRIGVQRHEYWIWSPLNPFSKTWFLAPTEYKIDINDSGIYFKEKGMLNNPASAVGYVLWYALEGITGVHRTNTSKAPDAKEPYNDYWRGGEGAIKESSWAKGLLDPAVHVVGSQAYSSVVKFQTTPDWGFKYIWLQAKEKKAGWYTSITDVGLFESVSLVDPVNNKWELTFNGGNVLTVTIKEQQITGWRHPKGSTKGYNISGSLVSGNIKPVN